MSASQHGHNFDIRVERLDGCTVLTLVGEMDFHGTPAFYAQIDGLWTPGGAPRLILELAELIFCDSAGLGALVYVFNQVTSAGGRLILVAVPDHLRRRLRISGLDNHFEFGESVEQAVLALGAA
ncbi:STAS domain-containing protein [Sphaerisporangium corydalis]|uniref:Anti-sigma factor antagonist n=1 Tax=Sphaerisporangium corydalis TaxID=1441875 RepID=A0ABV9EPU0_9ACTN|nr:STAS domain-containing protein [Sphaerisporangium corydalis]